MTATTTTTTRRCLKSRGHGQLLTEDGNSYCAKFAIHGKEFRSLDVSGSCLDWFQGRGWGLWDCTEKQNQQLVSKRSGTWCYDGNCIIASGDNVTTITTDGDIKVKRVVLSGNYNLPGGYNCGKRSWRGNTAIMYPSDTQNGPFPIASFAHGAGGGVLYKLCADVVKMGFVVISPLTQDCHGHGQDQLDAIQKAKSNPSLHPALAHVDWNRTAIFGHSFGGMHCSWKAYSSIAPWLNAVVVSHGWYLGDASRIDIPIMYMSGSYDRNANSAMWPAYQDNKVAKYKVYAAVNGGGHMEPAQGGRLNRYAAHFLACHVQEMQESCDKVYGFGEDSMCNAVDASTCLRSDGPGFSPTDLKTIQNVGSTSCLKPRGHGQVLTEDGNSSCAKFSIQAYNLSRGLFRSMDVSGNCLDWFEGHGWGLWDCHGQKNQQLESSGFGKWCSNENCIIVSGNSTTTP